MSRSLKGVFFLPSCMPFALEEGAGAVGRLNQVLICASVSALDLLSNNVG